MRLIKLKLQLPTRVGVWFFICNFVKLFLKSKPTHTTPPKKHCVSVAIVEKVLNESEIEWLLKVFFDRKIFLNKEAIFKNVGKDFFSKNV